MFKAIVKFLHEARVELAKVTWPTRQAAINLTLIVITVSILFTLYITVVDYGLTTGIKWVTQQAAELKAGNSSDVTATPSDIQVTPLTEPTE
ncbi:MAG: preprotein translocase subunit SecE [Patescibacteria group bacterium]|jgi:preprotein translocase subunit SecE